MDKNDLKWILNGLNGNHTLELQKSPHERIMPLPLLKNKNRIDGRGLSDVRPIECEVGILKLYT